LNVTFNTAIHVQPATEAQPAQDCGFLANKRIDVTGTALLFFAVEHSPVSPVAPLPRV
jgi:hypothetical protein